MHKSKKISPFSVNLTIDSVDLNEMSKEHLRMDVLRLDKIHPVVSGNKWFKLKNYLETAVSRGYRHILTFGGAWSNHIIATAFAAKEAGLSATGIIRGEQPPLLSDTLRSAAGYGMELLFISRAEYACKDEPAFLLQMQEKYPNALVIPEGGAGQPGIEGCREILSSIDNSPYTHILCALGTGTTWQGLASAALPGQQIIGIPVLKGMPARIQTPAHTVGSSSGQPLPNYHFGGYARRTDELIAFMNHFYQQTNIPSDFVYTGKLFYAAVDMARRQLFPSGSRLLVVHSGGLQGNRSLPPGTLVF